MWSRPLRGGLLEDPSHLVCATKSERTAAAALMLICYCFPRVVGTGWVFGMESTGVRGMTYLAATTYHIPRQPPSTHTPTDWELRHIWGVTDCLDAVECSQKIHLLMYHVTCRFPGSQGLPRYLVKVKCEASPHVLPTSCIIAPLTDRRDWLLGHTTLSATQRCIIRSRA